MRALLLCIFVYFCVFLAGCAGQPFFEVGVGATVDKYSDWYLRDQNRDEHGRDPTFEGALGVEWPTNTRCEAYHWSHLLDGGPFNSNPELYELRLRCLQKFGGIK